MSGFDWDDANRDHIALHGVTVSEVEEAALGETVDVGWEVVDGEERFDDLGSTASGRILRIITTERNGLPRVVTAFDAPFAQKRLYTKEMVNRYE